MGVIVWKLAEGKVLFDGTCTAEAPYTTEALLAQMTAVLGGIPKPLVARSKDRHRYFDDAGRDLRRIVSVSTWN